MTSRPPGAAARRVVRALPILIGALWIVGITRFRDLELRVIDYATLFAAAIAVHLLFVRTRGRGRRIELHPDHDPTAILLLASAVTGLVALVLGGLVEFAMPAGDPPVTTPWWLRTLWHGGCAFAAAWCRLWARLQPGDGDPDAARSDDGASRDDDGPPGRDR